MSGKVQNAEADRPGRMKNLQDGGGSDRGQAEPDKELTMFERFEKEFKYTIYNVLYVLLKDDDNVMWKEMLMASLDFLEIYYFAFFNLSNFPWHGGDAEHYIMYALEIIQINFWYEKLDYTTYIVLFYIMAFIIILVILDILYVSYSFQKKKFRFIWPLQILRSVVAVFVTGLFLPVLETFTIVIDCSYKEGAYRHIIDPDIVCYEGTHLIHAVISIIISIIFMIICLIVSLTFFEASMDSKNIMAKVNSRCDFYIIIIKIVGTYIWLFLGYPQYQWLLIVILLIMSYTAYNNFRSHWPYNNDTMNKFFCLTTGIFLWINFCLLIAKLLEHTDFTGALQIMFLGIPLIVGVILFGKDDRSVLLMKNINNFQTGEEVALQIRYFIHLIQSKDKFRRNAIILKGYIHQHEENCTQADCNLKLYKKTYLSGLQFQKKNQAKFVQSSHTENRDHHLYLHAQQMYKEGLKRFPNETQLQIQFAFFLMDCLGKKKEGILEFQKAMNFNPSFDEEFVIYRQIKMSEDFGDTDESEGGHNQELDIVGKLAYESTNLQFQENVARSAKLHYEFWSLLSEDRPDMRKLNYQGTKINSSVAAVESFWHQLQKLNADQPAALMLYSQFLRDILNDKEGSKQLMMRARNALANKRNHFEMSNDVEADINQSNLNGTPCIYVSGNSNEMGLITQCNTGACKLFGFSMPELVNHSLNKIIPEVYAKYHAKMLTDALQKGPENILKKERLILGRHKSGFLVPVYLHIKLIDTTNRGLQFVAIFQVDRKLMNSDVGFMLVGRDKRINSFTSNCATIFETEVSKMRKLTTASLDCMKVAPELFSSKTQDQALVQKLGLTVEFTLPDLDVKKQGSMKGSTPNPNASTQDKSMDRGDTSDIRSQGSLVGVAPSHHYQRGQKTQAKRQTSLEKARVLKRVTLNCYVTSINMNEIEEVGYLVKIQRTGADKDKQGKGQRGSGGEKEMKNKIKQPLFQFRFDIYTGKFIRELKDVAAPYDLNKNPQFANGRYSRMGFELDEEEDVKDKAGGTTYLQNLKGDDDAPANEEIDPKVNVKAQQQVIDKESLDPMQRKRLWGKGIQIYRLQNGKFFNKDLEEENKKMQEFQRLQEIKEKQIEHSQQSVKVFKSNLKSRANLQSALGKQKTPRALKKLQIVMNLVMLSALALGIGEFIANNMQYDSINKNFTIIEYSYLRMAEFQRIAYDLRSIILVNEKKLTTGSSYTTEKDFTKFLIDDISVALDDIYFLQNEISMASSTDIPEQLDLLQKQSVVLDFITEDRNIKSIAFNLNEAVLQMTSAVFSVSHLPINSIQQYQVDSFFITYNAFNDFLIDMRKSSSLYGKYQKSLIENKTTVVIILFVISNSVLILACLILIPVIREVNQSRTVILTLLVDIPNQNIQYFMNQCENFMSLIGDQEKQNEFNEGEQESEPDSKDGDANRNNSAAGGSSSMRGNAKIPTNLKLSYAKFVIQVACCASFIITYYSLMFYLNMDYVNDITHVNNEIGVIGQSEQYFTFAQNTIRELIYDPSRPILNLVSQEVALDTIEHIQNINRLIQEEQFQNQYNNQDSYNEAFAAVFHQSLCKPENTYINFTNIPYDCATMFSYSASFGLQTVIARYIETLKQLLKTYFLYQDQGRDTTPLLNSSYFTELFVLQFGIIKDSLRHIIDAMLNQINENYNTKLNLRITGFIIFIAFLALGYLFVWLPYLSNLKKEIWRTKQMLTIIPIEVIQKLPKVQEYIFRESADAAAGLGIVSSQSNVGPLEAAEAAKKSAGKKGAGQDVD